MASSSGKRIKTMGNKRKEPERRYSNKFLSRRHEQHLLIVQDRRLLMERKAGWIPDLAPQFGEELESRNWERIATYPPPANIAVVKEFYTNARPFGDSHIEKYMKGAEFDDMESVLCVPGGHFQKNRNGAAVHIRRADLTPMAKYWMAFSHANIQLCCHVFDITVNRALFLYCMVRGMSINIGQVITSEIQTCASTMNNNAPLGHPSLMTHPCELVGVNTSTPPLERPRKPIHKGQVATVEMIIGMYDTPPGRWWTMDEFNTVVAWPEEQAQASGAGVAEAPAMEEDDEDDDDFKDAKEGEEEDSDDSMG
ncbi:hypothetical protein LR48_Vigan04g094000 [Vigna angularis]|uniref:Putative plant transposon protein domain-containing protein n=1 Tax=Phaseolus angularis TaxID=3914 RepID=A0A0L9UDX1_PHAAN|nr:hypothetical protein LR48_Vigan04g094000 [Vigna angularis]